MEKEEYLRDPCGTLSLPYMGFYRKIKECFFDPCARDRYMKSAADEGFILLSKEL